MKICSSQQKKDIQYEHNTEEVYAILNSKQTAKNVFFIHNRSQDQTITPHFTSETILQTEKWVMHPKNGLSVISGIK